MCLPEITCQTIVYRAITSASKIDAETGRVLRNVFFRKFKTNEQGVSVFMRPEACTAALTCHAVVSLNAGFVYSLGLNIECDKPDHANILGLPFDNEPDTHGVRKAGQLAKHCRYVMRPRNNVARLVWDRFQERSGFEPAAMWHVVGDDPDEHWTAKFDDGTTRLINVAELAEDS